MLSRKHTVAALWLKGKKIHYSFRFPNFLLYFSLNTQNRIYLIGWIMLGLLPALGIVSRVVLELSKCEYLLHIKQRLVIWSNINKMKWLVLGISMIQSQAFSNQITQEAWDLCRKLNHQNFSLKNVWCSNTWRN